MEPTVINLLIILVFVLLVLWLLYSLVSLYEILTVRRAILQQKAPLMIPYMAFTTRPLRELAAPYLVNRAALAVLESPVVYGLSLPMQLHPFPSGGVKVRLSPLHTTADAMEETLTCRPSMDAMSETPEQGSLTDTICVPKGKRVVRNSHGDVVGEISQLPRRASQTLKSVLRRGSGDRRVKSDVTGKAANGKASKGVREEERGSGAMAQLFARSQLVFTFRAEGDGQLSKYVGEWLRPAHAAARRSANSTALRNQMENVRNAPNAPCMIQLRSACMVGADDEDIVRGITINTSETFGKGPATYSCYYTPDDEASCVRYSLELLDRHSRLRLGSRFQSFGLLSRPGMGRRRHHRSLPSMGDSFPTFSQASNNSFSTRTFRCGMRNGQSGSKGSNAHTETFMETSQMTNSRGMPHADLSHTIAPSSPTTKETTSATEVDDGAEFVTAVSTLIHDDEEESLYTSSSNSSSSSSSSVWMDDPTTEEENSVKTCATRTGLLCSASCTTISANDTLGEGKKRSVAHTSGGLSDEGVPTTEPEGMNGSRRDLSGSTATRNTLSPSEYTLRGFSNSSNNDNTNKMLRMQLPPPTLARENKEAKEITTSCELSNGKEQKEYFAHKQDKINKIQHVNEQERQQHALVDNTIAYRGQMYITPDRKKLQMPASVHIDAVEIALAVIQNSCNELDKSKDYESMEFSPRSASQGTQNETLALQIDCPSPVHPLTLAFMYCPPTWSQPFDLESDPPWKRCILRQPKQQQQQHEQQPTQLKCTLQPLLPSQPLSKKLGPVICVYSSTSEAFRKAAARQQENAALSSSAVFPPPDPNDRGAEETSKLAKTAPSGPLPPGSGSATGGPSLAVGNMRSREEREAFAGCGGTTASVATARGGYASHLGNGVVLDALREEGLNVPMSLRYVRVGGEVYAVTEVSDHTFVQYREERVLGSTPTEAARRGGQKASLLRFHASSYSLTLGPQTALRHQVVRMCWLCLRAEADVVLWPCAHFAVCRVCSDEMRVCCICHRTIRAVIQLRDEVATREENKESALEEVGVV